MTNLLTKDTTIRIGDMTTTKSTERSSSSSSSSSSGKVIECNVNMKVSLSNEKRSKIFQRTQSLLIILLSISFMVFYLQIKYQVNALEAQINSMNSNVAILTLRYDRLNRNYHKVNLHHQTSIKSPSQFANNTENNMTNTDFPIEIQSTSEEITAKDSEYDSQVAAATNQQNKRITRSLVTIDEENEKENNNETLLIEMTDVNMDYSSDARASRARRDDGRGKQRRKMSYGKLKRSRRRLGPLVATFVGAVPEQHVTDTVYIGPWVKRNESRYGFNKFHLVENKRSIEVTVNGLFMISAQIYYFGEPTHYSYWILLSSEGSSITRKVIKCATVSAVSATEASCYTSVIIPLRRGDRLHIQQQERDRLINLREGHSYVQVMLLSSDQQRKRINT